VLTVTLALVLSQQPAPPDPVEAEIERARVLITDLYEEKALAVLEPLLSGDRPLSPALRARALIYAGIAQFNLSNEAKAHDSFRDAIKADPGAVLPGWASRRIRAVSDEELAAAAPKPPVVEKPTPSTVFDLPKLTVVKPAHPPRQVWIGVALGVGCALAGGLSGGTYWKMNDTYARAVADPEGVSTVSLNNDTNAWYAMTWGLAVVGVALLAGFIVWAVNP
jgi:hypothetical protein